MSGLFWLQVALMDSGYKAGMTRSPRFLNLVLHHESMCDWVPYLSPSLELPTVSLPRPPLLKLFSSMTSSLDSKLFDSFKLFLEYYFFCHLYALRIWNDHLLVIEV